MLIVNSGRRAMNSRVPSRGSRRKNRDRWRVIRRCWRIFGDDRDPRRNPYKSPNQDLLEHLCRPELQGCHPTSSHYLSPRRNAEG